MRIEDRRSHPPGHPPSSISHPPSSILHLSPILSPLASIVVLLAGCQSPPPPKAETPQPLNYTAYLYSLYDTEWAARPRESLKEDRLEMKPRATLVVARRGEYAPRESLLQLLRAQTNLFGRVEGIPAVLEPPTGPGSPQPREASPEAVKDHLIKIRQLAIDLHADYLFLVEGTQRTNLSQSPAGVLDLTIIGQFIVGSHRFEVESRGSGALVDVASGRVLSVVTDENRRVTHIPTASLEVRRRRDAEKADMMLETNLVEKLTEQLRDRVARSPAE